MNIPLTMWDVKGNSAKGRSKEALQINRDLDRSALPLATEGTQEHQGTNHQTLPTPV